MARCLRCKAGNEWIEGTVRKRGVVLTKLETDMVLRAIGFAQAGEWPWEPYKKSEGKALQSGAQKIGDLYTLLAP